MLVIGIDQDEARLGRHRGIAGPDCAIIGRTTSSCRDSGSIITTNVACLPVRSRCGCQLVRARAILELDEVRLPGRLSPLASR